MIKRKKTKALIEYGEYLTNAKQQTAFLKSVLLEMEDKEQLSDKEAVALTTFLKMSSGEHLAQNTYLEKIVVIVGSKIKKKMKEKADDTHEIIV